MNSNKDILIESMARKASGLSAVSSVANEMAGYCGSGPSPEDWCKSEPLMGGLLYAMSELSDALVSDIGQMEHLVKTD